MRLTLPVLMAAATLALPTGARAQETVQTPMRCAAGQCAVTLTPQQLVGHAEALVRAGRYDEARPILLALGQAPMVRTETLFLSGLVAERTGDLAGAARDYRAILDTDPAQTHVRLELAGVLMKQGRTASADHHFKLAQADPTLSPQLLQMIRGARNVIRSQRAWRLNVDVGIAPDSNINNATALDGVTLNFGGTPYDFRLDDAARARSGTGQTGLVQAGLRLPVAGRASLLLDLDAQGTNYDGAAYDDWTVQLAAGPERRFGQSLSLSAQAVGAQRWYGGDVASRQAGVRLAGQLTLSSVARAGLQLDARRTTALFDDVQSGWQVGLYGSYEHVVSRSAIGSASLFVRRDALAAPGYANVEFGGGGGIAASLPLGFEASAQGSLSRALYDAPLPIFSADPRRDWRLSGRLTLGNRKLAVLGFSPTVALSWQKIDSDIGFFTTQRTRVKFGVARYF